MQLNEPAAFDLVHHKHALVRLLVADRAPGDSARAATAVIVTPWEPCFLRQSIVAAIAFLRSRSRVQVGLPAAISQTPVPQVTKRPSCMGWTMDGDLGEQQA